MIKVAKRLLSLHLLVVYNKPTDKLNNVFPCEVITMDIVYILLVFIDVM